ncbi:hypothetical protein ACFQ1E_17510 [Sphingomonas canadensis]|uniref:Uncharacterized protein n=1 Tax=Sphingomonas canadensis TaxID=1219257 RepID=A0ABW3HFS6_9SPHN|nr:hypothetical protein [Sphingomonas canadensis]MCW3837845.1 hypothetical protein [Sphingomonas canadensis]
MAGGIPTYVAAEISSHLDAIAAYFKAPRLTLVIRNPDTAPNGAGDLVMTNDDLDLVIEAIRIRQEAGPDA